MFWYITLIMVSGQTLSYSDLSQDAVRGIAKIAIADRKVSHISCGDSTEPVIYEWTDVTGWITWSNKEIADNAYIDLNKEGC